MLTPKLQEILENIERKRSFRQTIEEKELLAELVALDDLLSREKLIRELHESIKGDTQITSGPSGNCPCCGR